MHRVSRSARWPRALFTDAGSPAGAYTNLFLSNDQAAPLMTTRAFAASRLPIGTSGRSLASRAARIEEIDDGAGRKWNCFIVLEDCDLKTPFNGVAGRMSNAGQTCIGSKTLHCRWSAWQSSPHAFVMLSNNSSLADPLDEATTLAPLSSDAALKLFAESGP